MNATVVGLFTGIALGFAGAFGGFTAFVIVLLLAARAPSRPSWG